MQVTPSRQSTSPPWGVEDDPLSPLESDLRVDVCVVGAGIAGACVAYELTRRGLRVAVLDDGPVAGGETGHSTAHVTAALDDRYTALESAHGGRGARLAAESHSAAIAWYRQAAAELGFPFEHVDGYLVVPEARRDRAPELLGRELGAAQRAGMDAQRLDALSWAGREWGPALRFPAQAQIDPVAAARALIASAGRRGASIHLGTHATEFHGGQDARVLTAGGARVRAAHVVVATNTPVNDRVVIHTKQGPYRTYAVAFPLVSDVEPVLLWDGLWENDTSYHYVRTAVLTAPGAPRPTPHLIVGGEDHKTGQDDRPTLDRFACLHAWALERFAMLGPASFRWSGQVMEPTDGLGFIGRNPLDADNVYVVTGDSGSGITHAAIAGMLIPDLIQGRDHPWARLYDPSRQQLHTLGEYARENANAVAQYRDWVTPGEVGSEDQVQPGQGAILTQGVMKLAVYRDESGVVHRCSGVCPHLGGVLRWNPVEKSWDCPLHGSRFTARGKVLNGPANSDLEPRPAPETNRTRH